MQNVVAAGTENEAQIGAIQALLNAPAEGGTKDVDASSARAVAREKSKAKEISK